MHETRYREPTAAERQRLRAETRPSWASYGCIFLIFGVSWGFLLYKCGGWIASKASKEAAPIGQAFGLAIAAIILAVFVVQFRRFERRRRAKARAAAAEDRIELLRAEVTDIAQIAPLGDDEPVLAFQIEDRKILLLKGQWLYDPHTYGAPPTDSDPRDDRVNGLDDPFGFPCATFTVERVPTSGSVLRVRPESAYLAPRETDVELLAHHEFGDSALIDGTIGDLRAALDGAFGTR